MKLQPGLYRECKSLHQITCRGLRLIWGGGAANFGSVAAKLAGAWTQARTCHVGACATAFCSGASAVSGLSRGPSQGRSESKERPEPTAGLGFRVQGLGQFRV